MSGMAREMQQRIDADGGAGLDADAVPGTDGRQPAPAPPPAGESNADTGAGEGLPDTVPYARFKEVNDQFSELKGYKTLSEYGYDPDSLGRLAAFESQYLQDPIGTWRQMADNLDLPEELKTALDQHFAGGTTVAPAAAEGAPPAVAPTTEQPAEMKEALEYFRQQKEREARDAEQAQLGRVLSHWDVLDEADGVTIPDDPEQKAAYERVRLMAISSVASSGQEFTTIEDLTAAARNTIEQFRAATLGSAVRTGRSVPPPSLPGSASAPAPPLKFGTDIRAASRAAEAAIQRGEL
jgi:hypothetical protein